MTRRTCISWGIESRFYITNEDARVVFQALELLEEALRRPVFVGGAGMIMLQVLASLSYQTRPSFVDISPVQVGLFREWQKAVEDADGASNLRAWFERSMYPRLAWHYRQRGLNFQSHQVLAALRDLFGISFLFEDEDFQSVQRLCSLVDVHVSEIARYLRQSDWTHDFVYLSNVVDYMSLQSIRALFAACADHNASIYLLATTMCCDLAALPAIWTRFDYKLHAASPRLTASNRALGSADLQQRWNRPGQVFLLVR